MYRATRDFIAARNLSAGDFEVRKIDNVKRITGGTKNQCYLNAHAAKEEGAKNGKRIFLVSGWLVQPFNEKTNSVSIIAHWWNADSNGLMFDTSPLISNGDEYVKDLAILNFCFENDSRLNNHVHRSLLYQNGEFKVLINPEEMIFMSVDELKTEYFYDLS